MVKKIYLIDFLTIRAKMNTSLSDRNSCIVKYKIAHLGSVNVGISVRYHTTVRMELHKAESCGTCRNERASTRNSWNKIGGRYPGC